jgi:hypothetical protein
LLESSSIIDSNNPIQGSSVFGEGSQSNLGRVFGKNSDIMGCELFLTDKSKAVSNETADAFEKDKSKNPKILIEHSALHEPVFMPAKEILSISGLARLSDKDLMALNIDKTIIHTIRKAQNYALGAPSKLAQKVAAKLEDIIDGKVFVKDDEKETFWIRKNDGSEIISTMEAEGLRKLGLLWQLIVNKSIDEGTALLWDEPEANINPVVIPALVDVILELSRNGVQIFISTHDYFLPKYIEVLMQETDSIAFHSLYKTEKGVQCETSSKFSMLDRNDIIEEKIRLYESEIAKVME